MDRKRLVFYNCTANIAQLPSRPAFKTRLHNGNVFRLSTPLLVRASKVMPALSMTEERWEEQRLASRASKETNLPGRQSRSMDRRRMEERFSRIDAFRGENVPRTCSKDESLRRLETFGSADRSNSPDLFRF